MVIEFWQNEKKMKYVKYVKGEQNQSRGKKEQHNKGPIWGYCIILGLM